MIEPSDVNLCTKYDVIMLYLMKYYSEHKTNIIDTAGLNNVHLLIAVPMDYLWFI